MGISGTRTIWQIAGGPSNRSYADVFLKYYVGLIGPGDAGKWEPGRKDEDFEGSFTRQLASEAKEGDILLLRTGQSTIIAVGIIASDYVFLSQFDDVNGWDLQHGRRVRWCKLAKDYTFEGKVFGANPRRFSRTNDSKVRLFAEKFLNSPPTDWQSSPLPTLPKEELEMKYPPKAIADLIAQAKDFAGMFYDQKRWGDFPSEHEMVSHFAVPFFRALGWQTELIGVEWKNVDIALFRKLPRCSDNCQFVVEAKSYGSGVEGALNQAKLYVSKLGRPLDVILTDGIRYRMYSGQKDFEPIAYANLLRLKESANKFFELVKRS